MGVVRRARGLRGEIVAELDGSKPERFQPGFRVFLGRGDDIRPATVDSAWMHDGELVLKFSGIDDRTAADEIRGMEIRIPLAERPPAPEGEYYLSDLVGCHMESADGRLIGEIEAYVDFGAAPLLQVRQGERELLVPFVEGIYKEVDLERRRVLVELPAGLEEL